MNNFATRVVLTVSSFFMVSGIANANLLTNGSFEEGQFGNPSYTRLFTGSTDITGWTVIGQDVDWIGSYWVAADGTKSVDLDGAGIGGIQQIFSTIAGYDYTVTFEMSGNPDGDRGNKQLAVSAGNISNLSFDYNTLTWNNTRSDMKYIDRTFSFTALSASTTLSFQSIFPSNWGAVIDNVVVTRSENPVPEPASLLLFGTGILGLFGYARKKRQS